MWFVGLKSFIPPLYHCPIGIMAGIKVMVRMLAVFTSAGGGSGRVGECAGVGKIDLSIFIINLLSI